MAIRVGLEVQFEALNKGGKLVLLSESGHPAPSTCPVPAITKSGSFPLRLKKESPGSKRLRRPPSNIRIGKKQEDPDTASDRVCSYPINKKFNAGTPSDSTLQNSEDSQRSQGSKKSSITLDVTLKNISPVAAKQPPSNVLLAHTPTPPKSLPVYTPPGHSYPKREEPRPMKLEKNRKSSVCGTAEVSVTASDISKTYSAPSKESFGPAPSSSEKPILKTSQQSIEEGAVKHSMTNQQRTIELLKLSAKYQEIREQDLRCECFSWLILCFAIAILFYYRTEKILRTDYRLN